MTNDKNVYERLARLEVSMEEIRDNHLPSLDTKLNWLLFLIISTLVTVVVKLLTGV